MAFIESLIVLPLLLLLLLGIVQYSFIYTAKSTLDYATFMSARAGAIDHASKDSIVEGLVRSMIPLTASAQDDNSLVSSFTKIRKDFEDYSSVKILNPTQEAFIDFGVKSMNHERLEIPNEMLHVANSQVGLYSRVNIQDANLLKVQVMYGYPLRIPFVNHFIVQAAKLVIQDPEKLNYLQHNRLPILSTATVRMQSRAINNSWVSTLAEIENATKNAEK